MQDTDILRPDTDIFGSMLFFAAIIVLVTIGPYVVLKIRDRLRHR